MQADRAGIEALIARVRAATGADRELDEAIQGALFPDDPWWLAICEGRRLVGEGQPSAYVYIAGIGSKLRADTWAETLHVPAYTATLDAALALAKQAVPDRRIHFNISVGGTLDADACLSINRTPDEIASAHLMRPEDDPEEGFKGYVMEGRLHSAPTAPLAVLLALLTALATRSDVDA